VVGRGRPLSSDEDPIDLTLDIGGVPTGLDNRSSDARFDKLGSSSSTGPIGCGVCREVAGEASATPHSSLGVPSTSARCRHIFDERTNSNNPRNEESRMKASTFLSMILTLVVSAYVSAADLNVRLSAHSNQLIVGDPLYVELAIVNSSKKDVSALPPVFEFGTYAIKVYDPDRDLETSLHGSGGGLIGGLSDVCYEPGKPARYYFTVFLPRLDRLNHPFWKSFSRRLEIRSYYWPGNGICISSSPVDIRVDERRKREMRALEQWAMADVEVSGKGPSPGDLGLYFKRPLDRHQLLQVASQVQWPGELAELLDLTLQLQSLYAAPEAERDMKNRALVDWLKRQPEIKRNALTRTLKSLTQSYNMQSTVEALQTILN
jgi:hypothetical protein